MSKADIQKLLATASFEASSIGPLEQYVSTGDYDFEIHHALIKLYQFHPSKCNKDIITKILLLSMIQIPSTDFLQHLYLIPESVVRQLRWRDQHWLARAFYFAPAANAGWVSQTSDENIAKCIVLHDCLERSLFAEFWVKATGSVFEAPSFQTHIRSFISDIVAKAYRIIPVSQYSELINLKSDSLEKHLASMEASGWKVIDGNLHIPADSSTIKPKPTTEVLQFEQFGKLLVPLR